MARYAMIHEASGYVVNVIEWDGDESVMKPPADHIMVEDNPASAGPGFKYDGSKFNPPPQMEIVNPPQQQQAQQPQARAAPQGLTSPQGLAAPEGWRLSYARHMPPGDYVP